MNDQIDTSKLMITFNIAAAGAVDREFCVYNLLGALAGMPWVSLGSLWDAIGSTLGHCGTPWGAMGTPWGALGYFLGRLLSPLGRLGVPWGAF